MSAVPEEYVGERWKRLGDMLLDARLLTQGQLSEALAEKERKKCFLGQALVMLGYLTQDELISFLVKQCKIPHINLLDYVLEPRIVKLLPNELCLQYKLIPIDQLGSILTICMVNPLDIDALEHARNACPNLKIKPILCSPEHFDLVASRHLVTVKTDADGNPAKQEMSLASYGLKSQPAPTKRPAITERSAPEPLPASDADSAPSDGSFTLLVREVLGELLNTFQGPLQGRPESLDQLWLSTDHHTVQFSFTLDVSGSICYVSPPVSSVLGYSPEEFRLSFLDLLTEHPTNSILRQALTLSLSGRHRAPVEAELRAKDGLPRMLVIALIPVFDASENVVAVQGIARDVTRRAATEQLLYRAATHDTLTGLLNLRSFLTRLEETIALSARHGTPVTIAVMNVDDFTRVNEVYGHEEGDSVLQQMGHILKDTLRGEDILARSGGDEFCILMPQVRPEGGQNGMERYREALTRARFVSKTGETLTLTVTIGFTSIAEATAVPDELLNTARSLVRRGKEAGGNQIVVGD